MEPIEPICYALLLDSISVNIKTGVIAYSFKVLQSKSKHISRPHGLKAYGHDAIAKVVDRSDVEVDSLKLANFLIAIECAE